MFVNSQRSLVNSHIDITQCEHGKFPVAFLINFVLMLYFTFSVSYFKKESKTNFPVLTSRTEYVSFA